MPRFALWIILSSWRRTGVSERVGPYSILPSCVTLRPYRPAGEGPKLKSASVIYDDDGGGDCEILQSLFISDFQIEERTTTTPFPERLPSGRSSEPDPVDGDEANRRPSRGNYAERRLPSGRTRLTRSTATQIAIDCANKHYKNILSWNENENNLKTVSFSIQFAF